MKNGLLLAVSFLVALVAAEGFLRVLAPIPYSMKVEFLPDPHVGFTLTPLRRYTLASGGHCSVDGGGYRGGGFEVPKPPGVFRIAVLGGSSTFCYLTDDDAIWTARLQAMLREKLGPAIEVVNAGVPGYGAFESTLNYLYRVRRDVEPDAVIVYHTWNDLKTFRYLEEKRRLEKGVYKPKPIRSFLRRFQIAWRIRSLFGSSGVLAPREVDWLEGRPADEFTVPTGGLAHRFAAKNYDDLALLIRSDEALPILLSQGGLLSEENLDDPEVRERVYTEFVGLDYPEVLRQWQMLTGMISHAARKHRGVFVDVYSAVPHDLDHFRDHVHLTSQGNEVVARTVADALLSSSHFRRAIAASGALGDVRRSVEDLPVRAAQEHEADGGVE